MRRPIKGALFWMLVAGLAAVLAFMLSPFFEGILIAGESGVALLTMRQGSPAPAWWLMAWLVSGLVVGIPPFMIVALIFRGTLRSFR
jgi:hypothetical protein